MMVCPCGKHGLMRGQWVILETDGARNVGMTFIPDACRTHLADQNRARGEGPAIAKALASVRKPRA